MRRRTPKPPTPAAEEANRDTWRRYRRVHDERWRRAGAYPSERHPEPPQMADAEFAREWEWAERFDAERDARMRAERGWPAQRFDPRPLSESVMHARRETP